MDLLANFENYEKGDHFSSMLHDLLGDGIFNSDGEAWRVQRKVASRIFHVKNFRDRFTRYVIKLVTYFPLLTTELVCF